MTTFQNISLLRSFAVVAIMIFCCRSLNAQSANSLSVHSESQIHFRKCGLRPNHLNDSTKNVHTKYRLGLCTYASALNRTRVTASSKEWAWQYGTSFKMNSNANVDSNFGFLQQSSPMRIWKGLGFFGQIGIHWKIASKSTKSRFE
jgi:hypothetical protein